VGTDSEELCVKFMVAGLQFHHGRSLISSWPVFNFIVAGSGADGGGADGLSFMVAGP
jgi:hypothetical protein